MEGAKIEKAKQGACAALDQLGANDYVSMVVYDNRPEVLFPPQHIESAADREALKERIDHVRPGGGTAIYAGLELGAEQLRKHLDRERLNRIVLLSDGIANVGPSKTSDLAGLARELRGDGLSVTTIGLGDDYNEDLMTAIAEASHANYYYVRDAEKLPGIFSEELGAARTVMARGVKIHITAPEGVRLREILGHPEIECHAQSADISLSEYFGADKRRFLVRCAVEGPRSEPLEVAAVALRYEDVSTGETGNDQKAATVKFSDDRRASDDSLRGDVAKDVSILQNRASKELAVKLADEGKAKEAADVLRRQAAANSAAPSQAQIPKLLEENEKLESDASEIAGQGNLSKASRKQVQYENWQDKYQKR
jgi:Ca-activated chloride channel family protein